MSMFGQPKLGQKPAASLSSTLLARKGQAKPAMRPQGFGAFGSVGNGYDDLGWNDMGGEPDAVATAAPEPAPVPPVLVQREALREELAAPVGAPDPVPAEQPAEQPASAEQRALKSVSVATATRFSRETAAKTGAKATGRAAFTLRLDQDRHLRLRIASALHNASAQMLVTEALDQFLQALPEVDALVAQIPPRTSRKR